MKKLLLLLLFCLPIIGFGQPTTLLSEDFNGGFPSNWYGTQTSASLCVDSFDIENSANWSLDPAIQGNFMFASSFENGAGCEALTYFNTNPVDCTPYDSVFLSFDIDFDPYMTGNDTVVLWLWDGNNWNFIDAEIAAVAGGVTYNITQYISSTFTQIEWVYSGYDGNYCAIDNILIEGVNYAAPASWDCNPVTGACFDPMTGLGQYPTLNACLLDSCGWNTAINEEILELLIYPNPARSDMIFELPQGEKFNLQIFDVRGKLVLSEEKVMNNFIIADNLLSNGIYIVKLIHNSGLITKKIIFE